MRWWSWLFAPVAVSVAVRREYVCELLDSHCPVTTVGALSGVTAAETAGDRALGAQLLSSLAYQITNVGKRDDARQQPGRATPFVHRWSQLCASVAVNTGHMLIFSDG